MQRVHCLCDPVQQDSCIPLMQSLFTYDILLQVDVAALVPYPPKGHGVAAVQGQSHPLAFAPLRQFECLPEQAMMMDYPRHVGEQPEDVVLVVQQETATADVFAVLRCSAAAAVTANGKHLQSQDGLAPGLSAKELRNALYQGVVLAVYLWPDEEGADLGFDCSGTTSHDHLRENGRGVSSIIIHTRAARTTSSANFESTKCHHRAHLPTV